MPEDQQDASVHDIREAAMRVSGGIQQAQVGDAIADLKRHCETVIDNVGASHASERAREKLMEMIFWLQAAVRRADSGA